MGYTAKLTRGDMVRRFISLHAKKQSVQCFHYNNHDLLLTHDELMYVKTLFSKMIALDVAWLAVF